LKARVVLALAALSLAVSSCRVAMFLPRWMGRTIELGFQDIRPIPNKIRDPVRPGAKLAVLWVGHATALIQLEDKFVLTDPVFTDTVGQISKRLVEPGILPEHLPPIDVVLVSHMHFDHLSQGSLELIESKVKNLIVPQQGLVYVPEYAFRSWELARWERWEHGGLRITAVPVRHVGFRYGVDADWMTSSYTGYVVEYRGRTVYFGGDTGYGRGFREAAERFPHIDLALLPIAPIEPRDFMCRVHLDPPEALRAFLDLKARYLVPIHFDTFLNSDDEFGVAPRELRRVVKAAQLDDRLVLLGPGEQRVLE
jgi:N-acyl-phosphatidylethanolamine-hydrolysing phospholipase D